MEGGRGGEKNRFDAMTRSVCVDVSRKWMRGKVRREVEGNFGYLHVEVLVR